MFRDTPPVEAGGNMFQPWIPGSLVRAQAARFGAHLADRFRGEEVRVIRIQQGGKFFGSLIFNHLAAEVANGNGPDSIMVSDVRTASRNGQTRLLEPLRRPLESTEHVIMVDDIADTAGTLGLLTEEFGSQTPASLTAVTMLDRPEARREGNPNPDLAAFRVTNPKVWAIGCGMDSDGFGRDLSDIYGLEVDERLPPRPLVLGPHSGEPLPADCGVCIDAFALLQAASPQTSHNEPT